MNCHTMSDTERPIYLYNSLTRRKDPLTPRPGGRRYLHWYNCGPTVYDSSHMGHARSYVTFDIIRRILQDYFGYTVFFVQNVTDIDDKIIKRARQSFLLDRLIQQVKDGDSNKDLILSILKDVREGIQQLQTKVAKESDPDKKAMMQRTVESANKALKEVAIGSIDILLTESAVRDILMNVLDDRHKSEVTDNTIFSSLPKKFELEYDQDMESLNVLPPSCVTRVSEFVPEIIEYIEKIIERGYAYESNGSVYFDVKAFTKNPKHKYAKLVHEAVGNLDALTEGEGDLFVSGNTTVDEKKSPADFVLWKKSKEGEPSWVSKWGRGRPGWHIECSVMACSLLGESIDIHSGGIDLRFPHHDNEVAQSEAYYDTGNNWIDIFLHSGHLTIDGCKMSKSLKNFKTIKEVLREYSKRQVRLCFLLHPWHQTLNYSQDTLKDAVSLEKYMLNFLQTVKHVIRTNLKERRKWTSPEVGLNLKLLSTKEATDSALRDNIDTKTALDSIKDLINSWNVYEKIVGSSSVHTELTQDIGRFVVKILQVFGVLDTLSPEANLDSMNPTSSAADKESILMPFLQTLADFRLEMRTHGIRLKDKEVLASCDRVRDDTLIDLGIKLEDKDDGTTVVKIIDRDSLKKELEEKTRAEEEKRLEKERRKRENEEKEARNKIPACEWVKTEFKTEDYGQFDGKGLPTHDKEGNELSKGQRKKHLKAYELQDKKYQEFMAKSK